MNLILEPQVSQPTLLRTLTGEPAAPTWNMHQAGRYLPEYMAVKACSSFWEDLVPEIQSPV
jgi:uroporphyrinogen decarboxylase